METYVIPLLKIVVLLNVVLLAVTYMVLLERKVIAWVQVRLGPMRVGPHGVLQPIADAVKLLLKEDITPARADRWVFTLAPIVSMVPALIAFAVVPFDRRTTIFGYEVSLFVADINVGLLYLVAITSISVYGIILAGYSSNSKFPLLAGLRASAQLISYEVAITLMLVSVVVTAGTLSMVGIVEAQAFLGYVPGWIWFLLKTFVFLYIFIWIRATLPRYRYDQLMRLGWKVLIPLAIANLVVTGMVKVLVLL